MYDDKPYLNDDITGMYDDKIDKYNDMTEFTTDNTCMYDDKPFMNEDIPYTYNFIHICMNDKPYIYDDMQDA